MKLNLITLEKNKRNGKSEFYYTLKIDKVEIKLMWTTITRTENVLIEIFTKKYQL